MVFQDFIFYGILEVWNVLYTLLLTHWKSEFLSWSCKARNFSLVVHFSYVSICAYWNFIMYALRPFSRKRFPIEILKKHILGPFSGKRSYMYYSKDYKLSVKRMYECLHVRISACTHICMSAYLHVCMSACLHVCMSACLHVCMFACLHVCMSVKLKR